MLTTKDNIGTEPITGRLWKIVKYTKNLKIAKTLYVTPRVKYIHYDWEVLTYTYQKSELTTLNSCLKDNSINSVVNDEGLSIEVLDYLVVYDKMGILRVKDSRHYHRLVDVGINPTIVDVLDFFLRVLENPKVDIACMCKSDMIRQKVKTDYSKMGKIPSLTQTQICEIAYERVALANKSGEDLEYFREDFRSKIYSLINLAIEMDDKSKIALKQRLGGAIMSSINYDVVTLDIIDCFTSKPSSFKKLSLGGGISFPREWITYCEFDSHNEKEIVFTFNEGGRGNKVTKSLMYHQVLYKEILSEYPEYSNILMSVATDGKYSQADDNFFANPRKSLYIMYNYKSLDTPVDLLALTYCLEDLCSKLHIQHIWNVEYNSKNLYKVGDNLKVEFKDTSTWRRALVISVRFGVQLKYQNEDGQKYLLRHQDTEWC